MAPFGFFSDAKNAISTVKFTPSAEGVKIDVNISELVRLKTRAISKWQAAMESAGGLYTFNNNVSTNICYLRYIHAGRTKDFLKRMSQGKPFIRF